MSADIIATYSGIVIGAVTAGIGLYSYRDSIKVKKKGVVTDIVFPLISEFNTSMEFKIARDILDDKGYRFAESGSSISSNQKANGYDYNAGGVLYPKPVIRYNDLYITLRDHSRIWIYSREEDKVRISFDAFLDFLARLEYLMTIDLLDREDLRLFDYFVEKAAENIGVRNFVRIYKLPLYGRLDGRLDRNKRIEPTSEIREDHSV